MTRSGIMMPEKRAFWLVRSRAIVVEKVYFDEPVELEEVEDIYLDNNYADIEESEVLEILSVEKIF